MFYCPYINRNMMADDEDYGQQEIKNMLSSSTISIKMHSSGAYYAKYTVSYTHENKTYSQSEGLNAGNNKSIQIPSNSTNVIVKAEVEVWPEVWPFSAIWSDIFVDKLDSPTTDTCYAISGATLNTSWKRVKC